MKLDYIITSNNFPDSYDPLNADKTINLSVMRMLFATPIEINKDSNLISIVLQDFSYNPTSQKIVFKVKPGLTFSDNTPLTVHDVALSISRMIYFRPNFPVIKDILGAKEWVQKQNGLSDFPDGFKINNNSIEIQLTKPHLNPLFRFCLELFSIIPEKCIDLKSGKMKCDIAPSSGNFIISSQEKNKIIFHKNTQTKPVEDIPYQTIIFKYSKLDEFCNQKLALDSIVSGSEIDFVTSPCKENLQQNQIHWTPTARFSSLIFNPEVKPFDLKENRQYFAELVRENIKNKYPELIVEKSLFTALLPGYIEYKNLEPAYHSLEMPARFKGKKIIIVRRANSLNISLQAIEEVAQKLDMDLQYVENPSNDFLDKLFSTNQLPIDIMSSGFWAQDPVGDVAMFFTPHLHSSLSFIWKDENIYKLLNRIENETSPAELKKEMQFFNEYIYKSSLITPLVHFRRFFVTNRSADYLNYPESITSPAPWQLVFAK